MKEEHKQNIGVREQVEVSTSVDSYYSTQGLRSLTEGLLLHVTRHSNAPCWFRTVFSFQLFPGELSEIQPGRELWKVL